LFVFPGILARFRPLHVLLVLLFHPNCPGWVTPEIFGSRAFRFNPVTSISFPPRSQVGEPLLICRSWSCNGGPPISTFAPFVFPEVTSIVRLAVFSPTPPVWKSCFFEKLGPVLTDVPCFPYGFLSVAYYECFRFPRGIPFLQSSLLAPPWPEVIPTLLSFLARFSPSEPPTSGYVLGPPTSSFRDLTFFCGRLSATGFTHRGDSTFLLNFS